MLTSKNRDGQDTLQTYLLVGREDGKAGASGLVLLRCAESPEGNGPAAELGEPALKLRLSGVVRQA